jgi:TonB family protein
MKRTIVAILALAVPAVFHAQTATPAQPRSTQLVQTSELQPAPLALVSSAADRTTVATTPVRVSTGVIQPKLVRTVEVDHNRITLTKAPGRDALVVLSMTVDETGKPTNLKVVKSADRFMDEGVLEAVSQFRFQPALLDGQPVAIPVTLDYHIQ